jgi:alpha-D-ribose 1-methylphosphonate 5-triphosphate synthase subunit PhnH
MKCACVSDIEKRATEKFKEHSPFKRPVKRVVMGGVTLAITDALCESRTVNYLEIELEGQNKIEKMAMFHTFCPFCGVKEESKA